MGKKYWVIVEASTADELTSMVFRFLVLARLLQGSWRAGQINRS
jgi:hypothetical protein